MEIIKVELSSNEIEVGYWQPYEVSMNDNEKYTNANKCVITNKNELVTDYIYDDFDGLIPCSQIAAVSKNRK